MSDQRNDLWVKFGEVCLDLLQKGGLVLAAAILLRTINNSIRQAHEIWVSQQQYRLSHQTHQTSNYYKPSAIHPPVIFQKQSEPEPFVTRALNLTNNQLGAIMTLAKFYPYIKKTLSFIKRLILRRPQPQETQLIINVSDTLSGLITGVSGDLLGEDRTESFTNGHVIGTCFYRAFEKQVRLLEEQAEKLGSIETSLVNREEVNQINNSVNLATTQAPTVASGSQSPSSNDGFILQQIIESNNDRFKKIITNTQDTTESLDQLSLVMEDFKIQTETSHRAIGRTLDDSSIRLNRLAELLESGDSSSTSTTLRLPSPRPRRS